MKNKFFLLAITFCLPIHSQGVSKSFIPMAEIPAGSFYMGSDSGEPGGAEREFPHRRVREAPKQACLLPCGA